MHLPMKLSNLNHKPKPGGRERTFAALTKFEEAQRKLVKRCEELGISVPVMVC